MISSHLAEVDNALVAIGKQLNLLCLITPINIQNEKEKFFESSTYNPQFEYKIDLNQLSKIEKKTQELIIKESNWQGLLLNEVKEKFLNDCNFVKQIGGDLDNFIKVNRGKYISDYDLKDEEIIKLAEAEIANGEFLDKEKIYGVERVKDVFEAFLKEKNIQWEVVIDENLVPLLSVNYFQEQIRINPLLKLSQIELERMLTHEIETHVYRFLNGRDLFQMASIGLKDYEKTEEGLAAYNESLLFPEDKSFLKRFYLRYKAILFGEQNSFRKLYEYLHEDFKLDREESWRTALRIKRGLADTSSPGAFLKDKIYLQGFFAVRNLAFAGIRTLYKGKFSLEHLSLKQFNLNDDNLISSPKYLPSIYSKLNA